MPRPADLAGRLLTGAVVRWAQADEGLRRLQQASRLAVGALLSEALTPQEREALVAPLYAANWRASTATAALHRWESSWFDAALPPAPATLLVGGAGAGREVAALVAAGYTVDAFEPAAALAPALAASGARRCWVAGYRDLLDGISGLDGPYDAVIFGWGSLHHVLDVQIRGALWAAADALAPAGPLLASFWLAEGEAGMRSQAGGRVVASARRLGLALGARRGAQGGQDEIFDPRFGFARPLTRAEVEDAATALDRSVRWSAPGALYPHATLSRES